MEMGPQEGELGQGWGRQGPWSAGEEPGDGSELHRTPVLLSRKWRPEEGKKGESEHQGRGPSWHQGGNGDQHQRQENPGTHEVDLATLRSYLKAVFSLAQGEGLQGTGERRRAARRRRQQQSQQQAVEFPAAARAGIRGVA